MDRVGQKGDRSAEHDHYCLQPGGDQQDDEADLDRSDASAVRFHRVVDRIRRIMRMRHEEAVEEAFHPGRVLVPVGVRSGVIVTVTVSRFCVAMTVSRFCVVLVVVVVVDVDVVVAALRNSGVHSDTRSEW